MTRFLVALVLVLASFAPVAHAAPAEVVLFTDDGDLYLAVGRLPYGAGYYKGGFQADLYCDGRFRQTITWWSDVTARETSMKFYTPDLAGCDNMRVHVTASDDWGNTSYLGYDGLDGMLSE